MKSVEFIYFLNHHVSCSYCFLSGIKVSFRATTWPRKTESRQTRKHQCQISIITGFNRHVQLWWCGLFPPRWYCNNITRTEAEQLLRQQVKTWLYAWVFVWNRYEDISFGFRDSWHLALFEFLIISSLSVYLLKIEQTGVFNTDWNLIRCFVTVSRTRKVALWCESPARRESTLSLFTPKH